MIRCFGTVALLVALLALGACSVAEYPTPPQNLTPDQREHPPDWEYILQAGDELDIKFYYSPELNERVTVRPDGRISLQLVRDVQAAGLTPIQLANTLREKYAVQLSEPEVAVIVRTFSAQRVYVGGEVERPGEMALVGPLTVLQAVSRASGFKDSARLAEVLVIRRNVDRTPLVIPVNIEDAISGEDLNQDLTLMPYDVVFVPRSVIANVNKWVKQYVANNIPFSFGFRIDVDTFR